MSTRDKYKSLITKITLNQATFHNEVVEPTFINYFYGGNGTGKSTIGRAIKEQRGLEWKTGTNPEAYEILLFNQDFITKNFNYPDNLQAVFSIGEKNIEILALVEHLATEMKETEEKILSLTTDNEEKNTELTRLRAKFIEDAWKKTKNTRELFDACMERKRHKEPFADFALSLTHAEEHNIEVLKQQFDVAFDKNSQRYNEFNLINGQITYDKHQGKDLLEKSIESRSNSPFGQFLSAIKATDWVTKGHDMFSHSAGGKCPYCQQTLPADFEENLANCFDQQYNNDIYLLTSFKDTYFSEMGSVLYRLQQNLSNAMPSIKNELIEKYKSLVERISSKVELNKRILENKVNEPSKCVSLDEMGSLVSEVCEIIEEINKQIRINNEAVADRNNQKKKCEQEVYEHIAFELKSLSTEYKKSKAGLEKEIADNERMRREAKNNLVRLKGEISENQSKVVNSANAIKNINSILRDTNFQGFEIVEKADKQNYYEVVRSGEYGPARNLSEGEKNFIAFLYFYELTKGTLNPDSINDKIVVVDDPVSSMDGSAMYTVSAIIKEMVRNCARNANYHAGGTENNIKQIFILTHNVYFHKEITVNQEKYWSSTSFFMIRKADRRSTIKHCTIPNPAQPTDDINYNPIQNSYSALWEELNSLNSVVPVMDIMRRILDYYFVQLSCFSGTSIRETVLVNSKDKFIKKIDDNRVDNTKYIMASSLLRYMDSARHITDDINYVADVEDVSKYKEVFRMIFDAMGQIQHYNMMMHIN